ncbi:MAG: hypothetical protein LH472_10310 [Pyrinomonadaceae bacterium]|nr:hypothetical protein [Pyrinomonadaceae bacterium]
MNERKYNNQEITEYLLGSLPEIETERFDELSFTAEDFADALASAEKDLVDAYIHEELAGATLEKFKTHYLASPLRREKVEFAKNFQIYAKRNIAETNADSAAQESKPKSRTGFFADFFSALNIFKTPNQMRQWSFAAVLLAVFIFSGWLLIGLVNRQTNDIQAKRDSNSPREPELKIEPNGNYSVNSAPEKEVAMTNRETDSPPQNSEKDLAANQKLTPQTMPAPKQSPPSTAPKISIASFILAPPLRGVSRLPSFSIPKQTSDVAMQLQLESDDFTAYRVALVNQADRKLWRSGSLKSKSKGDDKILNIRFPAKLLKSQTYSLVVTGINSGGEAEIISNYPFQSVLK